ncbi:hypothetical protein [Alteraurantiacibacter aquimixticola]|uniref:Uncharacterized protein n=1 Tax=Alteraurantiacibacter aquimixticola TaxID=2489173 RepID=A0A4T3F3K1_9SPHN|nr:hypothetical protein [Alteraurantiacibacter aquimixticola]TIX51793.1 hypothetical protein E5222_04945 [Alteraurantiacibacter aquimixticola]
MTDHPIRYFASDEAVRRVASGLLDRSLPKEEWTHEAHLAACTCLLAEHPDFEPERDLPGTIARYNKSKGGVNDATQGYHETITQFSIAAVRAHLAQDGEGRLVDRVNRLLASERGRRDYPLRFYSKALLFSPEARLGQVEPDVLPLAEV